MSGHHDDPLGIERSRARRQFVATAELERRIARRRKTSAAVEWIVLFALMLFIVYMGAGGPAWPR